MKALSPILEQPLKPKENLPATQSPPYFAEVIVKILIDKLISLAITQTRKKDFNSTMPSYCSAFTESTLKTFINASLLVFDLENDNDLHGYTFTQPPQSLIERDASSQILLDKREESSANINEQNSIDTIDYNMKLNRTGSPLTTRRYNQGFNHQSPVNSPSVLLELKMSSLEVPKAKKGAIDIKPSFDLNIPPLGKEHEMGDIHKLRLELAIDLERKAKELLLMNKKKIQISKSASNIKEDASANPKRVPLFEMKTITFDSNGKFIPLRYLPIESFRKDFDIPRSEIKEETICISPSTASSLPKLKIPDDSVILTNINLPSTTNRKFSKNDSTKRIGVRFDYSGDNYEKIVPSPGVTIISQDELRVKKGEINYHRDFKKLSMADYRYLSEEILPNISSPMTLSPKEPNNSIELSTNFNNDSKSNHSFKSTAFNRKNDIKPLNLTKYERTLSKDHSLNQIMLKSKGNMSLSNMLFDNTEQTTSHEEHSLENRLKHKINFIPKKRERIIPLLSFEQIDRFNKIILLDNTWGRRKDNSSLHNKNSVLGRKNPIKREKVLNDIPDYRTRRMFFRKAEG